jgi:hypothetical protein
MRKILTFATLSILAGCAYPNSRIDQGAENGLLSFPGAPTDARVTLDGQDEGLASAYNGDHALSVKPGMHRVIVATGAGKLIDKKYSVGAGATVAVKND